MENTIRNGYVFGRAVVAVTFSPRLTAVLNTAHFLLKQINTQPVIVHAGEESPDLRGKLEQAINRSDFGEHPPVCALEDGNPADAIIRLAGKTNADLIVAGANARENIFRYYLGSVARRLIRYAPCSLLLLTHPKTHPVALKRVHCSVDFHKSDHKAVAAACRFADAFNAELYFTHSFSLPDWSEKKDISRNEFYPRIYREKEDILDTFLNKLGIERKYNARCISQHWGGTVLDYSLEIDADLIVMSDKNISKGILKHLIPKSSDVPLTDLPCSLLLTRDSEG